MGMVRYLKKPMVIWDDLEKQEIPHWEKCKSGVISSNVQVLNWENYVCPSSW